MSVAEPLNRLRQPHVVADNAIAQSPAPTGHHLVATPVDLTQADPTQARAIYCGTFTFNNITRTGPHTTLFRTIPSAHGARGEDSAADRAWWQHLHGFEWLRDLAASDAPTARINAAALMMDWIDICGPPTSRTRHNPAWSPDVAATRVMAWLRYGEAMLAQPAARMPQQSGAVEEASAVAHPADARPQRWFRSLARHVKYLNGAVTALPFDESRLRVRIALAMAALCMEGHGRSLDRAAKALDTELGRQVQSDGGHLSRNPAAHLRLLTDLLPLLRLYKDTGTPPPDGLNRRAGRMVEALRFFRHSHGHLARFNGTGTIDPDHVGRLLRFDGVDGSPVAALASSGFDRLASGRTVVLADTGAVQLAQAAPDAMAGALSFELSSGGDTFIMNCGWPCETFAAYRDVARATAAHSTLTIADTSSAQLEQNRSARQSYLARPYLAHLTKRPATVPDMMVRRHRKDNAQRKAVTASHDGYAARFGLHHERTLALLEGGHTLQGCDRLVPAAETGITQHAVEGASKPPLPAVIRFHVPPEISVSHLASGHSVLLATNNGKGAAVAWTFTCIDAPITLEESISFCGKTPADPPRKAMQIVLGFGAHANAATEIRWNLQRNLPTTRPAKSNAPQDDSVVGDLLSMLEDVPAQTHAPGTRKDSDA